MNVSVIDFKSDIDRYLELARDEELILTEDGKRIARIIPESGDFGTFIRSLQGILPETATLEEAREERMAKHERHL